MALTSKPSCIPTAVLILAIAGAGGAEAQESRGEEVAEKQRQKAANLAPYQPSRFERVMTRIEDTFASPPSGFYPAFGSVYPGGGLTPGVGYRQFYGRGAVWDATALYSLKNYKLIETGTRTPWNGDANRSWSLGTRAGWLDAPQVGYFGLGMDAAQPRANFRLTQGYAAATAAVRPTRWSRVQGEIAYEAFRTEEGHGRSPSIEALYSSVPGLFSSPTFVRSEGTVAVDSRPSPGYARSGGFYGATLANFSDVDGTYSFRRLDAEAIQHVPVLRQNWVLSFRGRVQSTLDDDAVVPYFLLPQLGSGRTLRGYETGRFRDRHGMLVSGEFRWIPSRLALDMALFYDAGKVTPRRADLSLDGLATDWGLGARFHGPTTTVLRIEAAKGSNGWRLVFATGHAF